MAILIKHEEQNTQIHFLRVSNSKMAASKPHWGCLVSAMGRSGTRARFAALTAQDMAPHHPQHAGGLCWACCGPVGHFSGRQAPHGHCSDHKEVKVGPQPHRCGLPSPRPGGRHSAPKHTRATSNDHQPPQDIGTSPLLPAGAFGGLWVCTWWAPVLLIHRCRAVSDRLISKPPTGVLYYAHTGLCVLRSYAH